MNTDLVTVSEPDFPGNKGNSCLFRSSPENGMGTPPRSYLKIIRQIANFRVHAKAKALTARIVEVHEQRAH